MKKAFIRSTALWADPRLWVLYALLGMLTAYYKMLWAFVLVALLLAYALWSWLWTFWGCRRLSADDPLTQTALFANDKLALTWSFENAWSFSLARCGIHLFLPNTFVCTLDENIHTAEQVPQGSTGTSDVLPQTWTAATAQWLWLAAKERRTVSMTVTAPLRGSYYLPPARVFAGDPSGLYEGFCQIGQAHFLNVFPALKGEADFSRTLAFDENLLEDLLGLDDPYQAMGTRDYESGDSPKRINWYATARTASVKSNVYERQISASCIVALDLSCGFVPVAHPNTPRKAQPQLEEAISLACSIALSQLSRGIKTAFVTNAPTLQWEQTAQKTTPDDFGVRLKRDRALTLLEAGLGTGQERRILELCARIDDTSRATAVGQQALWEQLLQIPPQTAVFLLCYHTMPKGWEIMMEIENQKEVTNPADFYAPGRLAGLPTTLVRVVDLSQQASAQ